MRKVLIIVAVVFMLVAPALFLFSGDIFDDPTVIYGDAPSRGSRIYLDGRFVATLDSVESVYTRPLVMDSARTSSRALSCYAIGDTVRRVGEHLVTARFKASTGDHDLRVELPDGRVLRLKAQLYDSPWIEVSARCGVIEQTVQ
jgi:hypothetical protein